MPKASNITNFLCMHVVYVTCMNSHVFYFYMDVSECGYVCTKMQYKSRVLMHTPAPRGFRRFVLHSARPNAMTRIPVIGLRSNLLSILQSAREAFQYLYLDSETVQMCVRVCMSVQCGVCACVCCRGVRVLSIAPKHIWREFATMRTTGRHSVC